MKIKKGYIIAIMIYIITCIILNKLSIKIDNNIKDVNAKVIETKKEIEIIKEKVVELKTDNYIKLKNGDDEQNKVVAYLWNKTQNIDLILTFYGESWLKASTINTNKNKTQDFGYCQLNSQYHNDYIKSNNFKIMSSQLDYCVEVYNKAVASGRIKTTFYAYNSRYSPRVRSQFVISQEAVDITYKLK